MQAGLPFQVSSRCWRVASGRKERRVPPKLPKDPSKRVLQNDDCSVCLEVSQSRCVPLTQLLTCGRLFR